MFGEPIFVILLMLFAWFFTGRPSTPARSKSKSKSKQAARIRK